VTRLATIHPDDVNLVREGDWLCFDAIEVVYRLPASIAARRRDEIAADLHSYHWEPDA